jgi:hypothetical protein
MYLPIVAALSWQIAILHARFYKQCSELLLNLLFNWCSSSSSSSSSSKMGAVRRASGSSELHIEQEARGQEKQSLPTI